MLERLQHMSIGASDGQEALSFLDTTAVDLLITDVNMPNMNGIELVERLRSNEKYKNLPIIVLTASGEQKVHKVALQKGATALLTQPCSSWELKEVVTRCLELAQPVRFPEASLLPS
jgi:CheY-like chemotaxis protein